MRIVLILYFVVLLQAIDFFSLIGISKDDAQALTLLNEFATKFSKKYSSAREIQFRTAVFNKNMDVIKKNNRESNSKYRMGMTRFTDLTPEEFTSLILMMKQAETLTPSSHSGSSLVATKINDINQLSTLLKELTTRATLIKKEQIISIDWRAKNKVGVIKQQGNCGSCYAFSALSAIQSMYMIHNMTTMGKSGESLGKTYDLTFSEQHIVDCCDIPKRCDMGCNGGYVWDTFNFINKNGVYLEQNYPYEALQYHQYSRKCKTPKGHFQNLLNKNQPFINITRGNIQQLKLALKKRPISVLIDATNLQLFFENPSSQPFSDCQSKHNHAVLLVGVDRQGNWLIKNSWGIQWENEGYITLAPGNTCGIADYATYPNPYIE